MQQSINQWIENATNIGKLTTSAAQRQAQQTLAFISESIQSFGNSQGKGTDGSQFSQAFGETSGSFSKYLQQSFNTMNNWIQDCINCASDGGNGAKRNSTSTTSRSGSTTTA